MKLKDVTRETKIADCDNLGPSPKSLCRYCSIETVGQLLDTPIEEVRALNYSKQTINNLKRFVADVKDVLDRKDDEYSDFSGIQTRVMFGMTFVKVLGCIDTRNVKIEMYSAPLWANPDVIIAIGQMGYGGHEYLFFTSKHDSPLVKFILKEIKD